MGSTAVSKSSESKVSRSYTPLSFYLDSAVNHPGPIRKGYQIGLRSPQSMIDESIGKNCIPLSIYRTTLVYHPAESEMDIYLTDEEKVRHKLSYYMDPSLSYIARKKNYIPCLRYKSAPNVTFCFQSSQSTPELIFGSFGPHSSQSKLSFGSDSSQSKLSFGSEPSQSKFIFGSFGSEPSQSKSSQSKFIFGSIGSDSSQSIPLSTKSKVSRKTIPDKFAFSILSKLPVKSLKRFGCVRKSWSILFDNSDFMTMYSNHFISRHGSDSHYRTFILSNHRHDRHHHHSEFHLFDNTLKLNTPSPLPHSADYTCVLGSTSVNGIFCLGQYYPGIKSQYVLWNPLTKEFMVVPSSPAELTPKHPSDTVYLEHMFHGFGYDQLRHDFKIIQYVTFFPDNYPTTSYFEIYSLKSNSWRMIDMANDLSHWGYMASMPFSGHEVYLDGACHWLVSDCNDERHAMTLLSFDLTREVFITTPIGEEPYNPYSSLKRLMVLNGSIALISNYHDDLVFQISILGKLGVTESWIKLYTYGPLPPIKWVPIGFGKMGHIFFQKKDYQVAYVDLSTQIIKEVGISGNRSKFIAGLYKESLLSL